MVSRWATETVHRDFFPSWRVAVKKQEVVTSLSSIHHRDGKGHKAGHEGASLLAT